MKKKIGIIGGGIGGLMLAYSLSEDKNLDITIYEKEKNGQKAFTKHFFMY